MYIIALTRDIISLTRYRRDHQWIPWKGSFSPEMVEKRNNICM